MTKQYTVYKTVNLTNGKFYIGVHLTDNPGDEYLGTGKVIKRAIAKYGVENFRKEILAAFKESEPAFRLERKLVAEVLGQDACYNLKAGGEGGFDWINQNIKIDYHQRSRIGNAKRAANWNGTKKNLEVLGQARAKFTNSRWMNKGSEIKRVPSAEQKQYEESGWLYGRPMIVGGLQLWKNRSDAKVL